MKIVVFVGSKSDGWGIPAMQEDIQKEDRIVHDDSLADTPYFSLKV